MTEMMTGKTMTEILTRKTGITEVTKIINHRNGDLKKKVLDKERIGSRYVTEGG